MRPQTADWALTHAARATPSKALKIAPQKVPVPGDPKDRIFTGMQPRVRLEACIPKSRSNLSSAEDARASGGCVFESKMCSFSEQITKDADVIVPLEHTQLVASHTDHVAPVRQRVRRLYVMFEHPPEPGVCLLYVLRHHCKRLSSGARSRDLEGQQVVTIIVHHCSWG